jgi:hypothetical protein
MDNDQIHNLLLAYHKIAKQALEQNKISGIKDNYFLQPESWGFEDPYFHIEHTNGTMDAIEYEKTSGCVVLFQNVNAFPGEGLDDDDISLDGFTKYLLGN